MKLLQINSNVNSCSHGHIAEHLGEVIIEKGHESFIAYGRGIHNISMSNLVKIGSQMDFVGHVIKSRLFDRHGFGSVMATNSFIEKINQLNPDLIHLHNIHGYYLNISILFKYLKKSKKPVVWTFHDCWPFTGHCTYFDSVNCNKWLIGCHHCPNKVAYPKSWILDNSRNNYHKKKELFGSLKKMILVSPSEWLAGHLHNSFLGDYEIKVINNGVDLNKYRSIDPKAIMSSYKLNKKYILGVANIWDERKGLEDFIRLRKILDSEIEIVLVGLSKNQTKMLLADMKSISHTVNTNDLAALYTGAEAFVNPTYVDNFPSVNLEALACGTPVITYNTGGSPEAIDERTGFVIEKGDITGLAGAIKTIIQNGKKEYSANCRNRSERLFNKNERFSEYLSIYQSILENQ